jgi:competence protein ComEC
MMDKLELILFNVGHGLSVALIEHPENYVTVVDMGSEEDFSPLFYLTAQRNLRADILYVTHPHGDHLSDVEIASVSGSRPDFLHYQDYDWEDVVKREKPELRENIKKYQNLIKAVPSGDYKGSGNLIPWRWPPDVAKETFGETSYINNSSLFLIYTWKDFKIAIAGDHETSAIEGLCEDDKFKESAKGTDILIAPHHGHSEGYTSMWPSKIGKPYITLISAQSKDQSVASGYSKDSFAKGVKINDETRYSLTTRDDGTIFVDMWYSNEKPTWNFKMETEMLKNWWS